MTLKILKLSVVLIALVLIGLSIKFIIAPTANENEQDIKVTTEPQNTSATYNQKMEVSGHEFNIQLVNSDIDKQQGLSGRESMKENEGMLFDMAKEKNSRVAFWMKDMKFDLDIIWIKDLTIIEITKNVSAPTINTNEENLKLYSPQTSVDMVLELNSGVSDKFNIGVGDKLILK